MSTVAALWRHVKTVPRNLSNTSGTPPVKLQEKPPIRDALKGQLMGYPASLRGASNSPSSLPHDESWQRNKKAVSTRRCKGLEYIAESVSGRTASPISPCSVRRHKATSPFHLHGLAQDASPLPTCRRNSLEPPPPPTRTQSAAHVTRGR